MTLTVTLTYGPIEAEISGEDREEVQGELLDFIEFLNENEEDLKLSLPSQKATSDGVEDAAVSEEEGGDEHPLDPIASELGVPTDDLDDVIYVDPDFEEDPQLLLDADDFGSTTIDQQRNAAYVLLYVWDECYGNDRMRTSKLNDIFALAGISTNNLYLAWRDEGQGKFDSQGQGPSASVSLTGVGERTAKTVLQDLVSPDT